MEKWIWYILTLVVWGWVGTTHNLELSVVILGSLVILSLVIIMCKTEGK